MKIVVHTQCYENYAAHTWNGLGECPEFWKAKGGSTYMIRNISSDNVVIEEDLLNIIHQYTDFEYSEYFQEFISTYSLIDDSIDESTLVNSGDTIKELTEIVHTLVGIA